MQTNSISISQRTSLASEILAILVAKGFATQDGSVWQFVCSRSGKRKGSKVVVYTAIDKFNGAVNPYEKIRILRLTEVNGSMSFQRVARINPQGSLKNISSVFSKAVEKAIST